MVDSYREFAHTKHLDQQDIRAQSQAEPESASDNAKLISSTSNQLTPTNIYNEIFKKIELQKAFEAGGKDE
jgi:hypothetical protein